MPIVEFLVPGPAWDHLATMMVIVSSVDMGPPRTSPMGSKSEWPGECHGNGGVSSECRWSTQMGVRGHGFRGVVQCATSEFNNLSVAESTVTDTLVVGHTMGQRLINLAH